MSSFDENENSMPIVILVTIVTIIMTVRTKTGGQLAAETILDSSERLVSLFTAGQSIVSLAGYFFHKDKHLTKDQCRLHFVGTDISIEGTGSHNLSCARRLE